MATLLMGYDIECAAIGEGLAQLGAEVEPYRLALNPQTTREGLEIIEQVHTELRAPATLFVCGRTLTHAPDAIRARSENPLFDIQQHTYSHVLFKNQPWQEITFSASPPQAISQELAFTRQLIEQSLGSSCIGLRTPFGSYEGLRGRPDLLAPLAENGIQFVSSWGRNSEGGNPTPWVQPFRYEEEGFPGILEIPFQFWLDALWFSTYGFDQGVQFRKVLCGAIDEIVQKDLVYGVCFHDWAMVAFQEQRTGWVHGLLEYALQKGVSVMSYTQYHASFNDKAR